MGVNPTKFVDVNIVQHHNSVLSSTRDTAVLLTKTLAVSEEGPYNNYDDLAASTNLGADAVTIKAYAKIFFDCGGVKLLLKKTATSTLAKADITGLANEYIVVGFADSANSPYTTMEPIAASISSDATIGGINEKYLVTRTNTILNLSSSASARSDKNLVVKYSTQTGAEMAIAAYLTRIDIYNEMKVQDYMFTKENVTSMTITDANYDTIISDNCCVDIDLSNAIRNVGGNCLNGDDIVNNYIRIIICQILTESLLGLLTEKLKSQTAVAKIYTTICQEMDKLKASFLSTTRIWTDADYIVTKNSTNYTIIKQNTPLTAGYIVKVLPYAALTSEQQTARNAPPVYVIYASEQGIRKITVGGEAI